MGSLGEIVPASDAVEAARPVSRLKRRADFLHVGKGRRWHGAALTLQTAERRPGAATAPTLARVGFTLTRKVGNSVVRNRVRRRLREAVRLCPELPLAPGSDYVIVGRIGALRLPFPDVKRELARAVAALQTADGRNGGRRKPTASPIHR